MACSAFPDRLTRHSRVEIDVDDMPPSLVYAPGTACVAFSVCHLYTVFIFNFHYNRLQLL